MLARDALPLHGGAVVLDDRGVLATGWSKGGKTEIVLGLMARGGRFVADEWCYLLPGDREVLGLKHPVRVWEWQLAQSPHLTAALTSRQRARLAVTKQLARVRPLSAQLTPTLGVSAPPVHLFGADRLLDRCRLDVLVLVESYDDSSIRATRIDGAEVATRMTASLEAERADLAADVLRYRFALPHLPAPDLAAVARREADLLHQAFDSAPAWLVQHPYPVDLAALADAVAELS
jgi:hypothetical protein